MEGSYTDHNSLKDQKFNMVLVQSGPSFSKDKHNLNRKIILLVEEHATNLVRTDVFP